MPGQAPDGNSAMAPGSRDADTKGALGQAPAGLKDRVGVI